MQRAGNVERSAVAELFVAMEVALQFDVDVVATEDLGEAFDGMECFVVSAMGESGGQRAFVAAGEADQAGGGVFELAGEDGAFVFWGAQLHAGEKLAEILVTGAGGDEEREAEASTEKSRSFAALRMTNVFWVKFFVGKFFFRRCGYSTVFTRYSVLGT